MPCMCNCYGCSGNYPAQPYTKTVSFPNDPDKRERWIQAMPNDPASLRSLKQINISASLVEGHARLNHLSQVMLKADTY